MIAFPLQFMDQVLVNVRSVIHSRHKLQSFKVSGQESNEQVMFSAGPLEDREPAAQAR